MHFKHLMAISTLSKSTLNDSLINRLIESLQQMLSTSESIGGLRKRAIQAGWIRRVGKIFKK